MMKGVNLSEGVASMARRVKTVNDRHSKTVGASEASLETAQGLALVLTDGSAQGTDYTSTLFIL